MLDQAEADLALVVADAEPKGKNAHLWVRHPEDYYIEPDWCSQRLFQAVAFEGTVVDPSCGSGRIVRAGRAHRKADPQSGIVKVLGYDLVRRGKECAEEEDFLQTDYETDNIVSNPPFDLCNVEGGRGRNAAQGDFPYIRRALATAERKVALLLPLACITGIKRSAFLRTTPLQQVLVITPRPSMPPGPVIEAGINPGNGANDYGWFIWDQAHKGPPELGWLNRDAA